jgi:hypothetical protein
VLIVWRFLEVLDASMLRVPYHRRVLLMDGSVTSLAAVASKAVCVEYWANVKSRDVL